jgi:pyrroloquinoline quinone biosynthesis protein B
LAYLPCVGKESSTLVETIEKADCVMFDGTFWTDDELIVQGLGDRRAEQMAHWPLSGSTGSLRLLTSLRNRRRILIHINNTNPILNEQSYERQVIEAAGIEVAYDGMELVL